MLYRAPLHSLQTLRLADFMMKKTMEFAAAGEIDTTGTGWSPTPVTPPRPLDLALSSASLRAICFAEAAFDQLVDDHEVRNGSYIDPLACLLSTPVRVLILTLFRMLSILSICMLYCNKFDSSSMSIVPQTLVQFEKEFSVQRGLIARACWLPCCFLLSFKL